MNKISQVRKEIEEEYLESDLSSRILNSEMVAINHGLAKEWGGQTVPDFINSALDKQLAAVREEVEKKYTHEAEGVWFDENYNLAITEVLSLLEQDKK